MEMDRHLTVGTLYDCNNLDDADIDHYIPNPSWRHNMVGCGIIRFLQRMYDLNVTYQIGLKQKSNNTSIDLYALPLIINPSITAIANPVHTVILWKFGFLLRRSNNFSYYHRYYTKPFARRVWDNLAAMAGIVAILFFASTWFEKRLLGGNIECSFGLELLLIIGGYCQHRKVLKIYLMLVNPLQFFPVEAVFISRRVAYFTFFLYSYIIYTVYTSNLLSHLVNDRENDISLVDLVDSDYTLVTFDSMKEILVSEYGRRNLSSFYVSMYRKLRETNIDSALEAIRTNRTAFLTDYISVYPILKRKFEDSELCDLIEIDLTTEVKMYMFASKKFSYVEQFKIGALKAQETGLIHRLASSNTYQPIKCESNMHHEVTITNIFAPMMILLISFVLSLIILVVERIHYKRNRVWPYVE